MSKLKVTKIHPFDFAYKIIQNETEHDVTEVKRGKNIYKKFAGKIYDQDIYAPVKSEYGKKMLIAALASALRLTAVVVEAL